MPRFVVPFAILVLACTGGSDPVVGNGNGSTSSSGGSSSGSTSTSTSSGGTTKQIKASDFDQACTADTDCAPVFEGDVCITCHCSNAAIAKTDVQTYTAASSREGCPQTTVACGVDCAQAKVTCSAGKCALTQ